MNINLESRYWDILKNILSKYDYSFYLFGSRATAHVKKFSDIDLFYMEDIPDTVVANLAADFDESDLPYNVDIVDYNRCDAVFKKIIKSKNYFCIQVSSKLAMLEKIYWYHLKFLSLQLGCWIKKKSGLSIIQCKFDTSMLNIIYGKPNISNEKYATLFRDLQILFLGKSFSWRVPPSLRIPALVNYLLQSGLTSQTQFAMICDLLLIKTSTFSENIQIKIVSDKKTFEDFMMVLSSCDEIAKSFYQKLDLEHLPKDENFFVGYVENCPLVIAVVFKSKCVTSVFTILSRKKAHTQKYILAIARYLLNLSKTHGVQYAVFFAETEEEQHLYKSLGFRSVGEFECFQYD